MRIGIIADTHLPGLIRSLDDLGPEPRQFLEGVDLILHAGDIIAPSVLVWCRQFAPVKAARGNNDLFEDADLADRHLFELAGWRFGLVHEVRPESRPMHELLEDGLGGASVDVLVTGDTHVQRLEWRDNVLFVNPGSPTLPHHKELRLGTVAAIDVTDTSLDAAIIALGETPDRKNPGQSASLRVVRGEGVVGPG